MPTSAHINEVLDGHVALDVECDDRLYLNAYVPKLQVSGQVVRFLWDHPGLRLPSPAIFKPDRQPLRREVKVFAAAHHVPHPVAAETRPTRWDDPKLDHVSPYLDRAQREVRFGVVAIVSAQEFQWVFTGVDRSQRPGAIRLDFRKEDRRVGIYTAIPTPLSQQDRAAGYWWELSMRQIEVSRTLVLDAPRRARALVETIAAENLDLGRPDQVELIFSGRPARRGRPAKHPQTFKTKVVTRGVDVTVNVFYKHSRLKQYLKDGRACGWRSSSIAPTISALSAA